MKLADMRALCDAATPGPWRSRDFGVHAVRANMVVAGRGYCDDGVYCHENDARFIAAARTLMPLLLDVAKVAEKLVTLEASKQDGLDGYLRELAVRLESLEYHE